MGDARVCVVGVGVVKSDEWVDVDGSRREREAKCLTAPGDGHDPLLYEWTVLYAERAQTRVARRLREQPSTRACAGTQAQLCTGIFPRRFLSLGVSRVCLARTPSATDGTTVVWTPPGRDFAESARLLGLLFSWTDHKDMCLPVAGAVRLRTNVDHFTGKGVSSWARQMGRSGAGGIQYISNNAEQSTRTPNHEMPSRRDNVLDKPGRARGELTIPTYSTFFRWTVQYLMFDNHPEAP
jgi:hypothetical protein